MPRAVRQPIAQRFRRSRTAFRPSSSGFGRNIPLLVEPYAHQVCLSANTVLDPMIGPVTQCVGTALFNEEVVDMKRFNIGAAVALLVQYQTRRANFALMLLGAGVAATIARLTVMSR